MLGWWGVAVAAEPIDEEVAEEVVITGTRTPTPRAESPVTTEVISRQDIESSGADTLAQLLEIQAGVQVYQGFGASVGVRLRGHESKHVLVLVDGQRTVGRVGGIVDLQRFPLDRIERVEIVKGASSALYGSDALGGVINLVTRGSRKGLEGDLTVSAGSYVTERVSDERTPLGAAAGALAGLDHLSLDAALGLRRGEADVRADLSLLGYDPTPATPEGPATAGNGMKQAQAGLRGVWKMPGHNQIEASGVWLSRDSLGTDAPGTGAVMDRLNRTETVDVTVGALGVLHPRWRLQSSLHGSWFRDQLRTDQRGTDALDAYSETRETLAEARLQVLAQPWDRYGFTAGVDLLAEDLAADRLVEGDGDRQRGAVYVQGDLRPKWGRRFMVLPGFRVDADSRFGAFGSPKLAIRVDPAEALSVKMSFGAGYRAPDFRELFLYFENPGANYRVEGNPGLLPERSWGVTLDVETRPHDEVTVTVSGWYDDVTNLIQPTLFQDATTGTPQVFQYANVGRAAVRGASAVVGLGQGPISGSLGYTYVNAWDLDLERPLSGRPAHQATASVRAAHKPSGLEGSVRSALVGPRPFDDGDQTLIAPTYLNFDAQAAVRIRDRVRIFVGVDNLLDAGDRLLDPLRPRRLYAGMATQLPSPSPR